MVNVIKPVAGSKRARTVSRDNQKPDSPVRDTTPKQVERSVAQYVQEQPLTSLLIAAGVGLVLGRFWMRR
jgi:ElaB/YqjD/DUF883 family membrane-anchored ribosome-binding protein